VSQRRRFQFSSLGITRGVLLVFGLELGLSLVFMMLEPAMKATIAEYALASPSQIFEHGRVWTILTSPFLQPSFFELLLQGFMLVSFGPSLERFWGLGRFYRFVAATSIVSTICGVLLGKLIGVDAAIHGLSPVVWGTMVAYGVVYAKQPVQIWGVLPLTGRQMMWGFIAFLTLFVVLQQRWWDGAAYAGAMVTAAIIVSKRWSPGLVWKRWKISRARAKLTVMQGGAPKPKRDEQKWLN
jgi:membrane associated rhomboid family serine protease